MASTLDKTYTPTKEQMVQIEAAFIRSYGRSYNRMQKAQLALMIANQSTNYKKIEEQANKIAVLGIMYKKRWEELVKIVRKKDGKDD